MDDPEFESQPKIFLPSNTSRHDLGPTKSSIQLVPALCPGAKRPERDVNHSPPSTVFVYGAIAPPPSPVGQVLYIHEVSRSHSRTLGRTPLDE